MIGIPSYKATGCGCGGGGGLSASPCGCSSGGECASCQGQGIVRPRFFAGQLLTEDDLQLLTDYVGHKNRLHNRHLFGEGVVCGLEVTCHPCGDGRVIVHPGYALDCCGNDLTLACAATLDITTMIRELRRDQLGGYDCGDPCPEPGADTRIKPQRDAAGNTNQGGVVPPPPQAFRYCLYLRYCEQSSDPVMPYSTGEDCGRLACEPTRIQEGVKFELRCRPGGDASNPMIERLCECVGDLNRFRKVLETLERLNSRTALAQAALKVDDAPFTEDRIPAFRTADEMLQKQISDLHTRIANPGTMSSPITQELISSVREAALHLNGYNRLPRETREPLRDKYNLSNILTRVEGNISQAVAFAARDSVVYFNDVRDWLLERLGKAPFLTDCTLRNKVKTMALPALEQGNRYEAKIIAGGNQLLIEAFVNFLRDCACRVLNPACMPCDESGVLLACLEVEDCDVVRVCNMERTFVLSPAAVRYWLPPLQLLGNLIERLCCDPIDKLFGRAEDDSNLDIGNLDFRKLLTDEVKRMLEDSLCLGSKGQTNPLTSALERALRPRERVRDLNSRDMPADMSENVPAAQAKSPAFNEQEAAPAPAEAKQPQPGANTAKVKAPAPVVKKAKTSSVKPVEKKTENETVAAKPAETLGGVAAPTNTAKTNGGKTNGAKTGGSEGEQK